MYEQPEWVGHRYARPTSGSLLPDTLRRDVADLNRQFLRLVQATPGPLWQPWMARLTWSFGGLDAAAIDAIATCPFTLFDLRLGELPPDAAAGSDAQVRDAQRLPTGSVEPQCQALAHGALVLAWRLADASPLSLRLALGLSAAAELLMNETRVSSLVNWARAANLLGARWPDHPVFWPSLLRAGHLRDRAALTRVYCLGITLLVGDLGLREFDGAHRRGTMRDRR